MAGSSRSSTAYELCLALGCSLHSSGCSRLPASIYHTELGSMQSLGHLHRARSDAYPKEMRVLEVKTHRQEEEESLNLFQPTQG